MMKGKSSDPLMRAWGLSEANGGGPVPAAGPVRIPFNRPGMVGRELEYIADAIAAGQISGDGKYTAKCQAFFEERYGIAKALLTTSCTDALEMAAILCEIGPGDDVIVPSYTFVSTANAFALRGARVVFADSEAGTPNIDAAALGRLVTHRTRAVVIVHYAGIACDMDAILAVAARHGLLVIEDAAQAIDACYKGKPLGSYGHLATFSFHETKNIMCGEGGLLAINDARFVRRAEIIRDKGTNRAAFFRGEVDRYQWVDIGSSFLPSDMLAAYLYAQLEQIDAVQARRDAIWNRYYAGLLPLQESGLIGLPEIPSYASSNAHMFYITCRSSEERGALIDHLKARGILAVFHYQPLHRSEFYRDSHDGRELPQADRYAGTVLRLPLYHDLGEAEVCEVIDSVRAFPGYRRQRPASQAAKPAVPEAGLRRCSGDVDRLKSW